MINKKHQVTVALIVAIALGGCASTKEKPTGISEYEREIIKSQKRTNDILAKAALLAAKAQTVRTKTEQAYYQPLLTSDQVRQARHQLEYIPLGMDRKTRLAWAAAPEPALQRIATISGYELYSKNQPRPIPEDVYIDNKLRNMKELIDIIETQSKGYIDEIAIVDDQDKKTITIIYSKF